VLNVVRGPVEAFALCRRAPQPDLIFLSLAILILGRSS